MGKLLARPYRHGDECVISHLIRLSEANGFLHIGHLLQFAGLNWKNLRIPTLEFITGEQDLNTYLSAMGVNQIPNSPTAPLHRQHTRSTSSAKLFVKHPKVCPICLGEDGYSSYLWSIVAYTACHKHRVMLVDTDSSSHRRLSWYRTHLREFSKDSPIIDAPTQSANSSALSLSSLIYRLAEGRPALKGHPAALQGLNLSEVVSMVQFVAHYQHRLTEGGRFNPAQMDNLTISQHYSTAVESLKHWPRGFHQLLSQYLVNPMSSRGHFGINKHYRDIHEKLYQQQANNGIKRLKAAFDQYIDLNWPTALQTKSLTRLNVTTEDRPLISQKEALTILDCREPRIKKFIEQRKLTPQAFKGKAYFNRNEVQALANLYQENWSFAQACKETELSRHQLLQLLRSKLIKAHQRPNHQNRDWLIDKQAWIKQLQSFQKKAQLNRTGYTLAGFQKQGFDIVKVFKLLKKGSLSYEFNPNTAKPFSIKQLRQINTHTKTQHQG